MLTDNHGRVVNYLRLAVTDRCNLRCQYCMPEKGLEWLQRSDILSYEEIIRLLEVFWNLGIDKVRFTGGEPFVRRDFIDLLEDVCKRNWFNNVSLTTNGVLTAPFVPKLKELGIESVNLSLDTMNRDRFYSLTRRDEFEMVMNTFHSLLDAGIKVRVNAVIIENKNEEDIPELASLALRYPVDVRFIEEMPFNGTGNGHAMKWTAKNIISELKSYFPAMVRSADQPSSTSVNYSMPGMQGRVGVIAAWTRSFCGTCNRLRITPVGTLKTCLYDGGVVNLRDFLRQNVTAEELSRLIRSAVGSRFANGHVAESHRKDHKVTESMATIGG